jgi:hypothetical protein
LATPQAIAPQAKAKENVAPAIDRQKKDALIDRPALQERSMLPPSKKEQTANVARDSLKQRREQDEVRREAEAPVTALSKSAEEVTSTADQKLAASAARHFSTPEPKHIQTQTGEQIAAAITPALSARALFYGEESGRADTRSMAKEQGQGMKPLAESAPQAIRPERSLDRLSQLGKAAGPTAQLKPLGLRYSFAVRGTDGQEQEVDAASAAKMLQPTVLTLEANQDASLQVWKTVGSSPPRLLWPEKETGQIALRMTAGRRQQIPLPTESEPVTLTVHLSRVPPEPITRQEGALYERISSNQLEELVTPSGAAGSQERATYVVNQDPLTAQIAVTIILSR